MEKCNVDYKIHTVNIVTASKIYRILFAIFVLLVILYGCLTIRMKIRVNIGGEPTTLRFASYYQSHMVLQRAPARAQIWGYAVTIGDTVNIKLNGTTVGTTTVTPQHGGKGEGVWSALLPAQKAGGPVTIDIRSSDGHAFLTDVLFGDVWVCSGQSNMVFHLRSVFNHSMEAVHLSHFDNIRFMKVMQSSSNVTVEEPGIQISWRKPAVDTYTNSFSAVCLLYAGQLSPHINIPIGLVLTAKGATHIEAWSSQDVIDNCSHGMKTKMKTPPYEHSALWNAMVYPLLRMSIFGTIWYQGEADAERPDVYACKFPAMIDDWRAKFNAASKHQTDKQFPFGFVQLAAYANKTNYYGFPNLRWSQTAQYGYVPNPRLQNVFMAVTMDLPDFKSPLGPIHSRHKHDVANRLALASRGVAYKESSLHFQGPVPKDFTQVGKKLVIEFDHGNGALEVRTTDGFELCCGNTLHRFCLTNAWTPAPVVNHDQNRVSIDTSGCHGNTSVVAAVRYAWEMTPCKFKMCPLYSSNNDLPAATFVKYGPFKTQ